MSFDRTLGDIQIASDLGVVTPLQQKVDNLLLPWTHFAELLFHSTCTSQKPHRLPKVAGSERRRN